MKIESKTLKAFESCTSKDYSRKDLNAIYVEIFEKTFHLVATNGMVILIGEYSTEEQWEELQKVVLEDYGTELPKKPTEGFIFLNKKTRKDHKLPCWVSIEKDERTFKMEMQEYLEKSVFVDKVIEVDENQEEIEEVKKLSENAPKKENDRELAYPDYWKAVSKDYKSDFYNDLEKPIVSLSMCEHIAKLKGLLGFPLPYMKFKKWNESGEIAQIEIPFDYQLDLYIMTYKIIEEVARKRKI